MRDRLIELLEHCRSRGGGTPKEVADLILNDGWIRPPVKVGQTVYLLKLNKVVKDEVVSIWFEKNDACFNLDIRTTPFGYNFEDISKTIFLTREEAEKALKETHNE